MIKHVFSYLPLSDKSRCTHSHAISSVYVFGGQFKGENMSKYLDRFQNGVNNERKSPGALSLVLDFSSP